MLYIRRAIDAAPTPRWRMSPPEKIPASGYVNRQGKKTVGGSGLTETVAALDLPTSESPAGALTVLDLPPSRPLLGKSGGIPGSVGILTVLVVATSMMPCSRYGRGCLGKKVSRQRGLITLVPKPGGYACRSDGMATGQTDSSLDNSG